VSWRATAFWSLLAALVGFGLFHVKYQVQKLEDQLARLNRDIVREQEQIHVLRAEATYLNRPERIEQLASKYLTNLAPPKPSQMSIIAQLPMRAPANTDPATAQSSGQKPAPAPTRAPLPKAPPLMTPVPVAAAGLDDQSPLPGGGR
jgi:cell division protein FtsL